MQFLCCFSKVLIVLSTPKVLYYKKGCDVVPVNVSSELQLFNYILNSCNMLVNFVVFQEQAEVEWQMPYLSLPLDNDGGDHNTSTFFFEDESKVEVLFEPEVEFINKKQIRFFKNYFLLLNFRCVLDLRQVQLGGWKTYAFFKTHSYVRAVNILNKNPLIKLFSVVNIEKCIFCCLKKKKRYRVAFITKKNMLKSFQLKSFLPVQYVSQVYGVSCDENEFNEEFFELKHYLQLFVFFFKIKKFAFFNLFLNIFELLPVELTINLLREQAYTALPLYALSLKKNNFINLWSLFFVEYSSILYKKMFFLTFFYVFIVKYLESLCSANVCVRLKNFNVEMHIFNNLMSWLSARMELRFKQFNRFFFYNEFLEILLLSLWKKDIKFFELWLVRFLEKIHYKYHKKFFLFLNKFFKDFFKIFNQVFSVKGIKIDIRGKVSVGGNAKKRHYLITYGQHSFSTKLNKISIAKNIVSTQTGVLGLELVLVY